MKTGSPFAGANGAGLGGRTQDGGQPPGQGRVGRRGQQPATGLGLELLGHLAQVPAGIGQVGDPVQGIGPITRQERIEQGADRLLIGQPNRVADRCLGDLVAGVGHHLVEQRLGVAHPAIGQAGDELERGRIGGHALGVRDPGQLAGDHIGRQAAEVVPLGPADDGGWDPVGIGRGQDEDDVVRWLLDQLEQRVERVRAEHVDLVDDVHPASEVRGGGERPHDQVAGIVHQAV